jgi:hypothetical protein
MMIARFDPTNSRLTNVRDSLAELHRALLDAERREMERETGRLSPGAYLQMLINDPRFAWLRPVGRMVATLDDKMHQSRKAGAAVNNDEVEKLCDQVAGVLAIRTRLEAGYRYRDLMQREPDVVVAHAAVVNALRSETSPIAA